MDLRVSIDVRVELGVRDGGERWRCTGAGLFGNVSGTGVGLKNMSRSGLCSCCANGSSNGSVYDVRYTEVVGETHAVGRVERDRSDRWFGGRHGRSVGGSLAACGREGRSTGGECAETMLGSSCSASAIAERCEVEDAGESAVLTGESEYCNGGVSDRNWELDALRECAKACDFGVVLPVNQRKTGSTGWAATCLERDLW